MDGLETNMEDVVKPHHVRITTHGKMHGWIEFALDFLEQNAEQPLILHTLPAELSPRDFTNTSSAPTEPLSPAINKQMDTAAETAAESNMKSPSALGQPGPPSALVANPAKAKAKEGITPCTSTIPRLISVTEIIKREYLKRTRKSLVGLHQYTEMACLEDLDEWKERQSRSEGQEGAENGDAEATLLKAAEKRAEELKAVLGGKRHIRISKTPYMRVTLSRREQDGLVERGATYQPPVTRQISKSAKARLKRRIRREAESTAPDAIVDDRSETDPAP